MARIQGLNNTFIHNKAGEVDGNENIQGFDDQFNIISEFKGNWEDNLVVLS